MRFASLSAALLALTAASVSAQTTPPELTGALEIKWMRDSEEYAALSRMVYRTGTQAVTAAAQRQPRGRPWAVVLDVDETTLDNSVYQMSRVAYRLAFDSISWNAWVQRQEAGVVPGVVEFIAAVRRLGGHVAWITNRHDLTRQWTQANLAAKGLWNDDDRLCLLTNDRAYTKAVRRGEVVSGSGACSWPGTTMTVLAWFGDNIQDFPQAGEQDPDAGNDAAFGTRYFMLPNSMYGGWVTRVTRQQR